MEIRLETVHGPVSIEDLGLRVQVKEYVWVSKQQMESSTCLKRLIQMGKLRVTFRPRCKVAKDPPRHIAIAGRLTRPRKGGLQKPFQQHANIQKAAEQAGMKPEDVKAMVEAAASQAAEQAVGAVMGQLAAQKQGSDLESAVLLAIQKALGGSAVSGSAPAGPAEPVFIPEGIVREGLDADVKVQAFDAEAGDLDAAAAALKRMKSSKRRKKK